MQGAFPWQTRCLWSVHFFHGYNAGKIAESSTENNRPPMDPLIPIHDEILQAVAAAHQQLNGKRLTTFFPMRGLASTGELMVVGRAVNRWRNSWTAAEIVAPARRNEVLFDAVSKSKKADCCPLSWVL